MAKTQVFIPLVSGPMTNIGSSYNPATTSVQLALPSNAASVAELAYINTSATGTVSSVGVTGVGTNYFGAYVPVVPVANIPATSGSNATITGITTNAAGALTGITIAGGTQYASAPVLTFGAAGSSAGLAGTVASTTLIAGVPQSIGGLTNATVPLYSGGVNLGVAATDSLTFAGNLTLTTASPAGTVGAFSQNWSQFNTVANTVFVGGNVTLNTNGTNANLGLNPIGGTGKYSFGAINATMGAGTLSVIENTTLNLGAITAANVNATSVGGDIVNSGTITSTGTVTVAANSDFLRSPSA